jgi:DNA replication protein DnaC
MLNQQTLSKLRQMKLYGMATAFERQLEQANNYELSFEERFGLLVDEEQTSRDNRRLARLIKQAKFKEPACLEDIDYASRRGLDKGQIAALSNCDWVKAGQKILIIGATGVGKTWLSCALGQQAARQGLTVRYVRVPTLLEDLKKWHGDGSFPRQMAAISKVDLLILDDWGLKILSAQERHDLLEIIEERHPKGAMLVASQLPVDHWHEAIGAATIADAILDRLLEKSHRICLKGESMRKTKSTGATNQ